MHLWNVFVTTMNIIVMVGATTIKNSNQHLSACWHPPLTTRIMKIYHTATAFSSSSYSSPRRREPFAPHYKNCPSFILNPLQNSDYTTTTKNCRHPSGVLLGTLRTQLQLEQKKITGESSSSSSHGSHYHHQQRQQQRMTTKANMNNHHHQRVQSKHSVSRRGAIWKALSTCSSSTTILSHQLFCKPSNAACLSGDTSPECIGVYKVPLDDAISSYIDTPEHLAKYAPDLKWVPMTEYPKSYKAAREELLTLQTRLHDLIHLVQKGELTRAGVNLLEITPRVTVAGRVVLGILEKNRDLSMRAMRTENAHLELLASLGAADIVIGQALNGRLGSITMAQIQILDDLTNASREFQDLLKALPETVE